MKVFGYDFGLVTAMAADREAEGKIMAKGHACPTCGRHMLQPYTTNQLRCTNCSTVVKKEKVL